jgi:hypothetical protein
MKWQLHVIAGAVLMRFDPPHLSGAPYRLRPKPYSPIIHHRLLISVSSVVPFSLCVEPAAQVPPTKNASQPTWRSACQLSLSGNAWHCTAIAAAARNRAQPLLLGFLVLYLLQQEPPLLPGH